MAVLRPAVKHGDKIYKAMQGDSHDAALPRPLYEDRKKDPNNMFRGMERGYVNHKGHFLDDEKAMSYAKEHDLIRSEYKSGAAKTSKLTSDMLESPPSFAFK